MELNSKGKELKGGSVNNCTSAARTRSLVTRTSAAGRTRTSGTSVGDGQAHECGSHATFSSGTSAIIDVSARSDRHINVYDGHEHRLHHLCVGLYIRLLVSPTR